MDWEMWLGIRQQRGFYPLEGWALVIISRPIAGSTELPYFLVENPFTQRQPTTTSRSRTVELKDPDSKLTPNVLRTRSPSLIQPSVLEPEEEERMEEGEGEDGGGEEGGDRESSQYDDEINGEDSTHTQPTKKVHSCFISKRHFSILSSLSSMGPKSSQRYACLFLHRLVTHCQDRIIHITSAVSRSQTNLHVSFFRKWTR